MGLARVMWYAYDTNQTKGTKEIHKNIKYILILSLYKNTNTHSVL